MLRANYLIVLLLSLPSNYASPAVTDPVAAGTSSVSFAEDTTTGTTIYTVLPSNGAWTYTLDTAGTPFLMNVGGTLILNAPLNFEGGTTSYSLTITVDDPLDPPATTRALTVQVSNVYDVTPAFGGTFTTTIDEELATGTSVAIAFTVTDAETAYGDTLTYSLTGVDASYFNIDPSTGTLTIASRINYDAPKTTLSFNVQVTDSASNMATQAMTVTVNDINDNAPVCSPNNVFNTVDENTGGGTTIDTVACTDADTTPNSDITYSIFSGDDAIPNEKFSLTGTTLATTAVALDYEGTKSYTLIIRAVDGGTTPLTGTLTYIIQVGAVNDNAPAWGTNTPAGLSHSVPENVVGSSIVTIAATDADDGTDGFISYQIVSTTTDAGTPVSGVFLLDSSTGELRTLVALDRESVQSYDVVVRAVDSGLPSQSSPDSTLTISVTDANDNVPTFTVASVLTGTVVEGAATGTSVLTLVAADDDATATFTYAVISGDTVPAKFQFSTVTLGQLELSNVIDLDQPNNDPDAYTLTVTVVDGGTPELTATTFVTVTVTPVNDHDPVMNTPVPGVTVPIAENTGIGTAVATVTGDDDDFGPDGTLTYSITGGNTGTAFNIDSTTGEIQTQTTLDFDAGTQQYLLEVTGTDGGAPARLASIIVTIDITNINDNTPACPSNPVNVAMDEGQAAVVSVTTLACTDADPADTISYSITGGNTPIYFSINAATGAIDTTQVLNFEGGPQSFSLTVNVADDGGPVDSTDITVNVIVNPVNEFDPVFAPATYTATIIESSPVLTNVVQVTATDDDTGNSDGTVRYSITSGDAQGKFAIDQTNGQITVANTLDREADDTYTLTITAADDIPGSVSQRVVTTTAVITISDFNDNTPVFNPLFYTASPTENSASLSVLLTVTAIDDDLAADPNSNIIYTVDPTGDPTGIFEFNGADLRIAAGKSLDFTTTPTFDLTITATDQGATPLSSTARVYINVQAANLNTPVFTNPNQNISIPEDTVIGTTILSATATDPDSGLFGVVGYSIISGNIPADSFVIGATTGDILVWSQLDYDVPPTFFNLTLEATDGGGNVADTWLYIDLTDVNDNYPQFSNNIFIVAIDENLAASTSIAQITATDNDTGTNADITYSFSSGDGTTSFVIDNITGDITTSLVLDFESKENYSLVVEALDGGTPTANSATTLVLIILNDLNDNTPVFTPEDFTIDLTENVGVGTVAVTMAATDADSAANANGLFQYNLVDTNFAIDSNTGVITTIVAIDRETAASHVLNVTAIDQNGVGPNTGTGTVTINIVDLNDNSPAITGTYSKTIPEDTAVGTVLYTIAATDLDEDRNAELSYAITAGDANNDFRIEGSTGILQLNKALDREVTDTYTLTVTVSDNGITSRSDVVTVTFSISDTNDNDPVFQGLPYAFSIAENVPAGSFVDSVFANDSDTGVNGAVGYEFVIFWQGNSTYLSIDGANGDITVNGGLDREVLDTYIIWVRAADNGIPIRTANTNITITILDLNDNDPTFDAASYSGTVSESDANGTSILTIGATDADIGVNADITFSIDTTNTAGTTANTYLAINSTTGELTLFQPVDRETISNFVFNVLAIDGGATPRTSTTTVTVTVSDVNDNNPVFSPVFYNTEVAYSGACTNTITTVTASDADSGFNGQVIYSLVSSTYSYLFSVDSVTGVYSLVTTAPNNFRYLIEASVRDAGSPSLTATTSATIRTDSFDPNIIVVVFKLSVDATTFETQRAIFQTDLQNIIRVTYPTALFRVWCVATNPLSSTNEVNVYTYTITDSSTDSIANVNLAKNYLTSAQTRDFFASSPYGVPTTAIRGGNLTSLGVQSVTPYFESVTPWAETGEGIAVLTVVSLLILALIIAAVAATVIACRKRMRKRPITPIRRGKKAKRASITSAVVTNEKPVYRSQSPPPQYSEKPLPMRSGEDGIASIRYDNGRTPTTGSAGSFISNGRAVDPETGKVYRYNANTNQREWLTTPEGHAVKVTHH